MTKSLLEAENLWRKADAVCFDVDSTVQPHEGIDTLAEYCGVGEAVAAWTRRAMDGGIRFEDALHARLELIQPTLDQVNALVKSTGARLTPGVEEVVRALRSRNVEVFLISGGFRQMIAPVAAALSIDPASHVIANKLLFDEAGNYSGFDQSEPTSRTGGKQKAVQSLIDKYGFKNVVIIGDGVTDMEACPPASLFIGFGGVVIRDKVRDGADWFVTDMNILLHSLMKTQIAIR